MHTPEEIKAALRCLGSMGWKNCSECPYHGKGLPPCRIAVTKDAEEYINEHEKQGDSYETSSCWF